MHLIKITIDIDKECNEDLPMHPDLDSTLSYSEDIDDNSELRMKRKHKRTPPLLTEYLIKKQKHNSTKVKNYKAS